MFHDTDEEVWDAAQKDIATLREAGFLVVVDVEVYGIVEARVSQYGEESVIQWMSESRRRFFPLVRDEDLGRPAPSSRSRGQQSHRGIHAQQGA